MNRTVAPKMARRPASQIDRLLRDPGARLVKSRRSRQDLGRFGGRVDPVTIHRRIDLWHCTSPRRRECWIKTSTITRYTGTTAVYDIGRIEEYQCFWTLDEAIAAWPRPVNEFCTEGLAIPVALKNASQYR